MPSRPKLLLLIPHLGGGGAERVFELLARHLPARKYELHLGLPTGSRADAATLPSGVAVHCLGARRVRGSAPALLGLVRRLRPNLILSTMAHLNFLVLALRPLFPRGTRVAVRQNGTVSAMLADLRSPGLTRMLYRLLYPRADAVLCQSAPMADDLRANGVVRGRLVVAPNPVDTAEANAIPVPWPGAGPNLLAVGRLVPQKGFDLLLEAAAHLRLRHPQLSLTIAGAGPEAPDLQSRCERLGLRAAVRFPGHVANPAVYYAGASIFVSSSRQEGMPNALLEAAAAGLPIVATPSSGGLVDLLQGQPGVWLASAVSVGALAAELDRALDALRPGARFEHRWIAPYRLENAIAAYELLIDRLLDRAPALAPEVFA